MEQAAAASAATSEDEPSDDGSQSGSDVEDLADATREDMANVDATKSVGQLEKAKKRKGAGN